MAKGELKSFKFTRRRVFVLLHVDRKDGKLEADSFRAFKTEHAARRAAAEVTREHGGEAVWFEMVPVARLSRPPGWIGVDAGD